MNMLVRVRGKTSSIWLLIGLGLCWASEELVTFCISGSFTNNLSSTASYLYLMYLPLLSLASLLFAASYRAVDFLNKPQSHRVVLLSGALGILVIALFPHVTIVVIVGVALYALSAVGINILWFEAISAVPVSYARGMVVATAAVTTVATLLWTLSDAVILLFAFVLLAASLLTYERHDACKDAFPCVSQLRKPRAFSRKWAAGLGVCILAMSFGFLQYTSYHYVATPIPFNETISHGLSLALLIMVLNVVKDAEHTFAAKLATTLMLFSFVVLSVFRDAVGVSTVLAAGTEGMLELVIVLALAELSGYCTVRPARLFGYYTAALASAQFIGCMLSIMEHAILPSSTYSAIGLILVALLIVSSVWLLNDKTVTAFLWGDAAIAEGSQRDGEISFEQRAHGVAVKHGLTARETEVLLLFGKGRSSSFIAELFCVSNNTVRSHILHLYNKCGVHSRQELITLIDKWK